mgnify:CR=1 FL=1
MLIFSRNYSPNSALDIHSHLGQMRLMIICICRRINDRGVKEAVNAGARSPEAVQAYHGCQFNCGKCRPAIGSIISDSVDAMPADLDMIAAE